jgi:lipopolysaccharide export system protein LptA
MNKILLLFLMVFAYGSNMEITSKHFEYNQTSNMSIFIGDVNVTKEKDNILSDKLVVYLTKDKKLKKLIATGNVRFIVNDKNTTYKGKSDILKYFAKDEVFIFKGKVHIKKLQDNQELYGDKVVINKKAGTANVIGGNKKPLKFIIKVND